MLGFIFIVKQTALSMLHKAMFYLVWFYWDYIQRLVQIKICFRNTVLWNLLKKDSKCHNSKYNPDETLSGQFYEKLPFPLQPQCSEGHPPQWCLHYHHCVHLGLQTEEITKHQSKDKAIHSNVACIPY